MRLGLMIGPERGRYRHKVAQLVADAEAAEEAGFTSIWVSQVPGDFDAFTAITLMGQATERIELWTAIVPIQTRHPIAMAQEALSNQAVCEGRFTLGLGASHHWIIEDMLGLSYDRPADQMRNYRRPERSCAARARWTSRTPGIACTARSTSGPLPPGAARGPGPDDAPPGPAVRVGDDPVDGRQARHRRSVVPRITNAAAEAGAAPGLSPEFRSSSAATTKWTRRGYGRTGCSGRPRSARTISVCSRGRRHQRGPHLAAGDESAVLDQLRGFRDAGDHVSPFAFSVRAPPRITHRVAGAYPGVPRLSLSGVNLAGGGGQRS
jgi:alkanesulfonate monooxygenase SsuD/methylene tetrahydromethanopterin reductase-like flavin-dependent oxidoreductase (luciferase family)